jgi:hypothetical protein
VVVTLPTGASSVNLWQNAGQIGHIAGRTVWNRAAKQD